ncbi:MAG: ribonuclease P protein component [Candidatus Nealsonbacteria bacterium]|nr:ribonuclease P protein component [Candidatus Nealsonbacteria bacterium]
MLPKKHRLRRQRDFRETLKSGRTLKEKFLILKARNNHLGYSRFGVVVSKKVSKTAVARNRIKRVLRSVIEEEIKEGATAKNIDAVLIALPGIKDEEAKEIRNAASDLFKKIKTLKL